MTLTCRCGKPAEPERSQCFNCRIRTVGFTYSGGGTYGQARFNEMTIAERRAEIIGDRVVGVDVVPASDYGR